MQIGAFQLNQPLPDLNAPHVLTVIRPWIDVGRVGTITLRRVEKHLQSQEIARLSRPGRFYDFTRYRPKTRIRRGRRQYTIPTTTIKVSTLFSPLTHQSK